MPSSHRAPKAIFASVFVMFVAALTIVAALFATQGPAFLSAPDEVRPWATAYHEILGSSSRPVIPPLTLSPPQDPVKLDYDGGTLHIIGPVSTDPRLETYPPEIVTPTADFGLPLQDGSSYRCLALMTAYPDGPGSEQLRFHAPDTLESISHQTMEKRTGVPVRTLLRPRPGVCLPRLFLLWDHQSREHVQILGQHYFDARTQVQMEATSHVFRERPSYRERPGAFRSIGAPIYRWHDGAFLCAVDYVDGTWESGSLPIDTGAMLHLSKSGYQAELIQIEPVPELIREETRGVIHEGGKRFPMIYHSYDVNSPPGTEALLFLAVAPPREPVRIRYKAVFKDGSSLNLAAQPFGNSMVFVRVRENLSNIQELLVEVSNPEKRTVFNFASFPGAPPTNAGAANLYDIRIPYLSIPKTGPLDMKEFFTRTAQMELHPSLQIAPKTVRSFHGEFEDISVAELMVKFQEHVGGPTVLHCDQKSFQIYHPPNRLVYGFSQLRKKLNL